MASRAEKKEMDPELLMKKKFRAKCLFRALGRLVMENIHWLIEDVEEYEGVDDVKRRVEQAVRGKTKQKALLKIKDKALLNKPAKDRTDQEKKYIYRIIGGLKCFKRYPSIVKKRLAAVTYFKYYGPNRVIVRQHQEASAIYFIVSGQVVVSQQVWDGLLQKYVSVDIGYMNAGDMFGEVSLLHGIARTATCTTVDHCEFLQLLKEDFKSILLQCVQKQWDEVRHAMSFFSYFDALDEVAYREGCIVAKLKSYNTNETLLGDGSGVMNYVYFILTGRVQMIESLKIIVHTRLGRNYYTLYDPYVEKEESEQDIDKKWFSNYPNLNADQLSTENESAVLPKRTTLSASTNAHKRSIGSILKDPSVERRTSNRPSVDTVKRTEFEKLPKIDSNKILPTEEQAVDPTRQSTGSTGFGLSATGSKLLLPPLENEGRSSIRYSVLPTPPGQLPIGTREQGKIKTFFMQVCQMNPGSTFGFGENMRDRRIVALTPVSCMLMPKIWLVQRNTANIWTRIQYYLEKKIPTKAELFSEFVKQHHWEVYRKQCVNDVIARSNTVNYTTLHDVPYSIRLEEMFDI